MPQRFGCEHRSQCTSAAALFGVSVLLLLQLLDEGADIHAISPKRNNGGSALAEAIAGKHEALVELLLRYGGDPFTENPAGKTPLDLALEGRAVSILRACERHALFAGHVSTRVRVEERESEWVQDNIDACADL